MTTLRFARRFAIPIALLTSQPSSAATLNVPGVYRTITAALQAARDGDVIEVAAGTYTEQVRLINSSRDLTLRGNPAAPASVAIDGNGVRDAVIQIQNWSGTLLIEGLTVTGGRGNAGFGGGFHISNSGNVVVRDCVIAGNRNSGHGAGAVLTSAGGLFQRCVFRDNAADQLGGGALVQTGSTTVFEQCQFVNNVAGVVDPHNGGGGGLYVRDASPTLIGCLVQGNHAKFAGGGIGILTVFDAARAEVTLRDTIITENTVVRANASMPPAEGGGMHIEDNSHVVLERCRVTRNHSNQGAGLNAYRAHYTIIDSVIEDNVNEGDAAAFGAGVFAAANDTLPGRDPVKVELIRSVVRRNSAPGGAGIFIIGDYARGTTRAVLDVSDSIIAGNTISNPTRSGSGMYLDRVAATIRGSAILDNRGALYGGGILALASTTLSIDNTTIADNTAADHGGAIFINEGGALDVTSSRLVGNTAAAPAGAGAIAVFNAPGPIANPPITGAVTNSVLTDNGPNFQIVELDCDAGTRSAVQYVGNTITSATAGAYWAPCQGEKRTVLEFNGVSGKASENVDVPPSFATFLAAPGSVLPGQASVVGWAVRGATPLTIAPGVGPLSAPAGTVDVTPAVTTTYALSSGVTGLGSATVEVGCAAIATPIPRTPRNGAHGIAGGNAVLAWYESAGATEYDVYLDSSSQPTTVVAQNMSAPTLTLGGLAPDQEYRWRIAARGPACSVPTMSPTWMFRTRSPAAYDFSDDFADGEASDWTTSGAGAAAVESGALVLRGRNLMALPPTAAAGDGMMSMTLGSAGRRWRGTLVFAYRDTKHYRGLTVTGSGRYHVFDRNGRRRRVVKKGRCAKNAAAPMTAMVEVIGESVHVSLPGADVTADFPAAIEGRFGILMPQGRLSIDDVFIATY